MSNTSKSEGSKAKNSKFMAPVRISDALAKIVGPGPMPRTEITSKIWAYIKQHGLQDPKQKRIIRPDALLSAVIGKDPVDMFQMTKLVNEHILK